MTTHQSIRSYETNIQNILILLQRVTKICNMRISLTTWTIVCDSIFLTSFVLPVIYQRCVMYHKKLRTLRPARIFADADSPPRRFRGLQHDEKRDYRIQIARIFGKRIHLVNIRFRSSI